MNGGYASLFKLQCRHDYFADGVCRPLSLVPTVGCALLLERYQLGFRVETGGGEVYYQPGISPLDQFLETAPLAFWLVNSDPTLLSYTEVGTAASPSDAGVFYFDNLDAQPDGQGVVQLHPPGPLAAPQLPAYPARFSIAVDAPVRAAALSLHSRLTGISASPVWQARSPDAFLSTLPFAFGALEEGGYRLSIEGGSAFDFWLGVPPRQAWGLVAIYPGGRLQANNFPPTVQCIATDGNVQPKTYTISLNALSLRWRYWLVGQSGMENDLDNYEMVATPVKGNPVGFAVERGKPIDGQPVYCFVSQVALPLAERPGDVINVQLRPRQGVRQMTSLRLGYPQPRNISGQVAGERYADVHVPL